MKAFIQYSNGLPTNVNTYAALRGFELLGADIEPFTREELESGVLQLSLERGDIVCGYVGVVQKALSLLGVQKPELQSWPDQLTEQLGRRVWRSTLSYGLAPVAYANLLSARWSELVEGLREVESR
jgi:hypothetical protein